MLKSLREACNPLQSILQNTELPNLWWWKLNYFYYGSMSESWFFFLSSKKLSGNWQKKKTTQFSNVLIIFCCQNNEWYKRLTDLNQVYTDIKQHPIIEEQQISLTLMRRDWWISAASCPFHHSNSLSIFPIQRRRQETSFTCRCRCVQS